MIFRVGGQDGRLQQTLATREVQDLEWTLQHYLNADITAQAVPRFSGEQNVCEVLPHVFEFLDEQHH
jgi:hypothetical protein